MWDMWANRRINTPLSSDAARFVRRRFVPAALAMGLFAFASQYSSAAIVYQADFEPPTFATGSVSGQDGWIALGDGTTDANAAVIQNAIAKGTQALKVSTAPLLSDAFFFRPDLNYDATNQLITVTYELNIQPALDPGDPTGRSFFMMALYTPAGNLQSLAGITDEGAVIYSRETDFGAVTLPNPITNTSGWNTISFTSNFADGTLKVSLNGVDLGITDGFVDTTTPTIGDVDVYAFPSGYDQGIYDNIMVVSGPVPEPASLAALSLLAGPVLLRRHRRD